MLYNDVYKLIWKPWMRRGLVSSRAYNHNNGFETDGTITGGAYKWEGGGGGL